MGNAQWNLKSNCPAEFRVDHAHWYRDRALEMEEAESKRGKGYSPQENYAYRKKISDGRRQRLILLDSVYCSPDGSKCGLKDCHGKEPNSNDTSEGRPQPVVVERHCDARKQAQ
jgi:hypothetical protein